MFENQATDPQDDVLGGYTHNPIIVVKNKDYWGLGKYETDNSGLGSGLVDIQ